LVSFLCDLTHVALMVEYAKLCPGDEEVAARPSAPTVDGVSAGPWRQQ
jgi:hypothetical protein